MQAVIMAGGQGRRMRESGASVPKPLVAVAGQPLLAHLAAQLERHGFSRFIVAVDDQALAIKRSVDILNAYREGPGLECVNTGVDSGNAGRLLQVREILSESRLLMCWCDVISDLDLSAMVEFHRRHGRLATVAAVPEPERYGYLQIEGDQILNLREKQPEDLRWINAGYAMLEPAVLDRIEHSSESWEHNTMPGLIADDQVRAFRHEGYWQAVDSLADRDRIERDIEDGRCPWLMP